MQEFYSRSLNLPQDPSLHRNTTVITVITVLETLLEQGILTHAPGNCLSISEMISSLLCHRGIASRLVEVKLMHTWQYQGQNRINLVGYDGTDLTRQQGLMDTHIVVITDTPQPLLIDATIPQLLPAGRLWIIEPLQPGLDGGLCDLDLDHNRYRYTQRSWPRLPGLRQDSILTQLSRDLQHTQTIRWMKWVLAVIAAITVINLVLNTSQLILRMELIEQLEQQLPPR